MSGVKFYRDRKLPFFELKICGTTELSYKKHAHEEYSLGFVDQGESDCWYKGKLIRVCPNTMVIFPPDLIHACNPVRQNYWRYKMLFINAKWVRGFLASNGSPLFDAPVIRRASTENAAFCPVRRMLESLTGNAGPLEKEAGILAVFEQIMQNDKQELAVSCSRQKPKVDLIREYLHGCFREKITLDQLAQISALDKFRIIRLFKEAFNIPPHTYQTLLRVNYAKQELRKHRAITEVALEAGFYDQSHFSKVFKSHVGVTPDKYQKL